MYPDEIKKELASIISMVKAKIEIEKGFGIDTVTFTNTKVSDAIHQISPNSFTEIKSTETPVVAKSIGIQAFMNTKETKIKLLEELRHEMLVCHKCPLSKTRTNLVFGVGNSMADLMFIGEAPGRDEDLQGEPFVGRAGQLLTKIIEAIDMKRSDVYIANVLKCRPPGNRNPLPEEIIICIPYLIKQIEIIQPKVLCALGAFAAQALLNTKAPVGTLRGRFHDYKGVPMMVTFHPAYLLRNPNDKAKVWDDMKKVRDFLKNEFT
ncbi:MAG: uracil-DNA glycosylase [Candidatus Jettenia caeni]|nr:MAG: uracil-DNA glycosylase [Candidatus Jettenia caeni]